MGRIKRFRTAWSRHHRSGGFGIHSPFAFNFVQNVLGERSPYYAYARIAKWRTAAKTAHADGFRTVSQREAELLFRIANFFNPAHLLVMGAHDIVPALSVKAVSKKSTLYLHAPAHSSRAAQQKMLHAFAGQVRIYSDLTECVKAYFSQISDGETPFVMIEEICDEMELEALKSAIFPIIMQKGVVIVRNMTHSALNCRFWAACCDLAEQGQTYTNYKTGILVATPKLQREHFTLWL